MLTWIHDIKHKNFDLRWIVHSKSTIPKGEKAINLLIFNIENI